MPDETKTQSAVPGPGAYKPRIGSLTADQAQATQTQSTRNDTMKSPSNQSELFKDNSLYSNGRSPFVNDLSSKVNLIGQKNIGKNPPPKLQKPKGKNVASIPSSTVAPPEDKSMMY